MRSAFRPVGSVLRLVTLVSMAVFVVAPAASADANVCYSGGALLPNFKLNGNALLDGTDLVLTANQADQVSSIMYVPKFLSSRDFHIELGAVGGIDGMAFVMHNSPLGTAALGPKGGGLGYGTGDIAGTPIAPSVVVEFDGYQNSWDLDDNHVAITRGGDARHNVGANIGLPVVSLSTLSPPLTLATTLHLWIDYTAATHKLDVYIASTTTKPGSPALTTTAVDLAAELGADFFMGFTAATAGQYSKHEVTYLYASDTGAARSACCTDDASCGASAAGHSCDPAKHLCGACTAANSSTTCSAGNACDLTPAANVCKPDCTGDFGASGAACTSAAFPACITSGDAIGTCAVCNGDSGSGATFTCGTGAPYCDSTGYCGRCTSDSACTATNASHSGYACDLASGVCVFPHPSTVSGSNQRATIGQLFSTPLTARVLTPSGLPVSGVTVTFGTTPSNGADATLSAPSGVSNAQGDVWVTATANGTGGHYSAWADIAGTKASFALENFDALLPTAVSFQPSGTAAFAINQSLPVVFGVLNADGSPLAFVPVQLVPASGPADMQITPTSGLASDSLGSVSFALRAGATTGPGSIDVMAGATKLGTFNYLVYDPAVPTQLKILSGGNQAAGPLVRFAQPLVFEVDNAGGGPVAGVTVTPSSDTPGTLTFASPAATDWHGRAQVLVTAGAFYGGYFLTLDFASGSFWVPFVIGAPDSRALQLVSGGDMWGLPGQLFAAPLQVRVVDGVGAPVAGERISFTTHNIESSVQLSAPSAITDSAGLASITVTGGPGQGRAWVDCVGVFLEEASVTAHVVVPGDVGYFQLVSGGDQTAIVGTPFAQPVVIRLVHFDGTPVAGASVRWSMKASFAANASPSPTLLPVTDANGEVSFHLTANRWPGNYQVIIRSSEYDTVPYTFPVAFTNIDGPPGPPARLAVQAGNGQTAALGASYTQPLSALVTDAVGAPVPGVVVSFATPASGASATLSAATAITDDSGVASVTATANTIIGAFNVTASVAGITSVSFGLTNQPSPTAVALTSSLNPSTYGDSVTFTAMVSGAGATPTGVVTFSAGGTPLCVTVSLLAGEALCTTSLLGGGASTVAAEYLGDGTHATSTGTYGQGVNKAGQVIAFNLPDYATYGDAALALAPFAHGGASNMPVTFKYESGPGSVAGGLLDFMGAGTVGVTASQAGNANYAAAADVVATITVNRAAQAILFAPPARTFGDAPFELLNVTTGGLSHIPTTFAWVSGPGSITAGSTLTISGAGSIVLSASQAGNADYDAAPTIQVTIAVGKAAATVSLDAASLAATYDRSAKAVTAATVPAGLPIVVTYDASDSAPINARSYAVVATVNDANYQGSAIGTLVIGKAPQTLAFAPPANRTYGEAPFDLSPFATGGGSSSAVTFAVDGGPGSLSGSLLRLTGVGSISLSASQAGDANYSDSSTVHGTIDVGQGAAGVCYSGGLLLPNFKLNGNALLDGTDLVLTADDSDKNSSIMYVPKFLASRDFHIELGAAGGADGMAFVMHNAPEGTAALGPSGGGLGYGSGDTSDGTPITPSVAVEFDGFKNGWDPDGNHVAITRGGDARHDQLVNVGLPVVSLSTLGLTLSSATVLHVWIDYAAASHQLDVSISADMVKPATPALSATIDLGKELGTDFFMGFTASTGGSTSKHEVTYLYASDSGPAHTSCCDSDADCAASAQGASCDTAKHLCGACTATNAATACGAGLGCDLNPAANVCKLACTGDNGSALSGQCASAAFPVCVTSGPSAGTCAVCDGDFGSGASNNCGSGAPYCDATGYCGRCSDNTTCTATNATRGGALCDLISGACANPHPAVASGDNQKARIDTPFAAPLQVRVVDPSGTAVPGITVTFGTTAADSADAILSGTSAVSGVDGYASVTATANHIVGRYSAWAETGGVRASFSLENVDASLPVFALVGGGADGFVGLHQSLPVAVQVFNALDLPISGVTVQFILRSGPADVSVAPSEAVTAGQGLASFNLSGGATLGTGSVDVMWGSVTLGTFRFSVYDPAVAAGIKLIGGGNQFAAPLQTFARPLVFEVDNAGGFPLAGVTVTASLLADAGALTIGSPTVVTDARGRGQVSLTAGAAFGSYYVVLQSGPLSSAPAIFNVVDPAARQLIDLSVDGRSDTVWGLPNRPFHTPVQVRLVDGLQTPVADQTITFALDGGGSEIALSATSAITDANGLASVTLTAGPLKGQYRIRCSNPGAEDYFMSASVVDAADLGYLEVVSGGGQSAVVGTAFAQPLVLRLLRYDGTPVPGTLVGWYVGQTQGFFAAGASFSPPAATTDSGGNVSFQLTANRWPGDSWFIALFSDALPALFVPFTNVDPPAHLAVQGGSDQSAPLGAAYATALSALVTDADGTPVPGIEVSFTAPESGASAILSAATAVTDHAGIASVTATATGVTGTFAVTASVPGLDAVTFTLTNQQLSSTIALASSQDPSTYGDSVTFTATVSGGGATPTGTVTFKIGEVTLCGPVTLDSGEARCTVSSLDAPNTIVTASYGGDGTYSASQATHDQGVEKAAQSISFSPPASAIFGDGTIDLALSASGGGSGSAIVFAVLSGPGSLTGTASTLTITGAGAIVLTASQGGSANYNAAVTVQATISVGKLSAPVTLDAAALAVTYDGSPKSVGAVTSPVGLAVAVTYAGSVTAPGNAGSYTVVATINDVNYQGSASRTLVIAKAAQAIVFTPPAAKTYGDAPMNLALSASGGGSGSAIVFAVLSGPASLTVSTLTITGAGSVVLSASQAGSANYDAANPVQATITVGKLSAPVTLDAAALAVTYDGSPKPVGAVTSPAGLSVAVTYAGSVTAPSDVGSYAVVAKLTDANHQGSASGTLVIARAAQAISFKPPLAKTYGDAPFDLTSFATGGGSGSAVVFAVLSGPGTLTVSTLTITGAGAIVLTASQGGSANYDAAVAVQATISVGKLAASVTLDAAALAVTYDGSPKSVGAVTSPVGLAVAVTYAGSVTAPSNAGSYAVVATLTDANHQGSASGTLVIAKAAQAISFRPPATKVYGDAPFDLASFATGGASGNPITFAFVSGPAALAGSKLTITGAGSIVLSASQAGSANYNAANPVQATIASGKAVATAALVPSVSSPVSGQALAFRIDVTSAGGVPSGTVTLLDGASTLGAATLAAGSATVSVPGGLLVGSHALSASCAGDANFLPSAPATLAYAVGRAASAVALSSSRPAATTNQPIRYTATVAASSPGGGTPSGDVAFKDGASTLGTATLSGGVASFSLTSLAKGTHAITAGYAGDGQFTASSGTLAGGQVVPKSAPVAGSGQAVAFDGATQAARVDDPTGALDGAKTVELWFQARSGSAAACLVQQGEGAGLRFGLCLTAARDALVVRRGSESTAVPAALGTGWHHVALVSDDANTLLLLDESAIATLTGGFGTGSQEPLVIGAAPSGSGATDRFAGVVDELRIWSSTRTAAELAASARQPVAGDAAGLLGLWRMDEGAGPSLFDAAPAHLEATLTAPGEASWIPSSAWTRRTADGARFVAPFLAGYDPDGDELAVAMMSAPQGGVATAAAGTINYAPDARFAGVDVFTYQVASGGLTSEFTTEVEVAHVAECHVLADCSNGDACVNNACVPAAALQSSSGGCGSTSSGQGASTALVVLLALALLRRRRALKARPVGLSAAAGALLLGLLLAFALPPVGEARAADGFAARTLEPAPAGDRFLAVPDAAVEGHLVVAAGLGFGWADRPLVLRLNGNVLPNGELVQQQLTLQFGASLALWDRLLLDVSLPFAAAQSGQQPFSDIPAVSGAALEDLRVGARLSLLQRQRLSVAAGVALWLPVGDTAKYGSDGTVRGEPSVIASGRASSFVYAGDLGVLVRQARSVLFTDVGSALTYRAALGWLLIGDRLQVGPELFGRYQFNGSKTSALEALASARWVLSPRWSLAAAVGTRLGPDAPGAAPLRALFQLAWSGLASAPTARPPPAPMRPPVVAVAPPPPLPEPPPAVAVIATPEVKVTSTRLEITETIFFEPGTMRIEQRSHHLLDAVATVLQQNPQIERISVEGHSDASGPRAQNLELSRRRAKAVCAYLVERKVASGRLEARGFGPDRPIADNATVAGREQNRRVEFVISADVAR